MWNVRHTPCRPRWAAVLPVILVAALALVSVRASVSEASGCTNASIAGAYGLTATGTLFGPNGTRSGIALVGRRPLSSNWTETYAKDSSQAGGVRRWQP
jgi:hypothetical protein